MEIENPYNFYYEMTTRQRRGLLGSHFTSGRTIYFPFELSHPETNYNRKIGLISVNGLIISYKKHPYFGVRAFSPDDLDMQLDYTHRNEELRQQIIKFIGGLKRMDTSYDEVLEAVYNKFKPDDTFGFKENEISGHRIGWLDSVRLPSKIHRTTDNGETTVCGHRPKESSVFGASQCTGSKWEITSDIPRSKHGSSNYCRTCFQHGGKSLPFIEGNNAVQNQK